MLGCHVVGNCIPTRVFVSRSLKSCFLSMHSPPPFIIICSLLHSFLFYFFPPSTFQPPKRLHVLTSSFARRKHVKLYTPLYFVTLESDTTPHTTPHTRLLHVVRRPANLLSIVTERHEGGGEERGDKRGERDREVRHGRGTRHDGEEGRQEG